MDEDTVIPFDLPAVARKKFSFDGGMLSADSGVLLLREVERQLGIASRLAACLNDSAACSNGSVREASGEMLWDGGEDIASIDADVNRWSAPCRS